MSVRVVFLTGALGVFASTLIASAEDKLDRRLTGEWEIVEMIYQGRLQDFGGRSGGRFKFEEGKVSIADSCGDYGAEYPCTAVARKIDVQLNDGLWKGLYEIKDGEVRLVLRFGDRPKRFDAVADPRATLYKLKRLPK